MTRAVGAWIPAATWAAVLFYFSSRPGLPVDLSGGLDKIAHFAAYLVLGLLLMFATDRWARGGLIAVALGIAYGLMDEVHQSMVPGRFPDFNDWLADSAGTIAGVLVYFAIRRRLARARPVDAIPEGSST